MDATADIGLIGLAVMGQNLVLNMDDHGFTVAVYNRTTSKVDDFFGQRGQRHQGDRHAFRRGIYRCAQATAARS